MIDIYIRSEGDPNYQQGFIETNDQYDMFVSQIEMALVTNKTEVLGDFKFGGSLEQLIHTFNFNETQIKSEVSRLISGYCTLAQKFSYSIEVSFYRGTQRDVGLIDIIIDNTKAFGVMIT